MKKKILFSLMVIFTLIVGLILKNNYEVVSNYVENDVFFASDESVDLTVGIYTSSDGHTLTVLEDGSVLYDSTYSLTATSFDRGYVISGKIGTNSKSVIFYQLNDSKIVSGAVVSYTYDGSTVYLYDYTVFSMDNSVSVSSSGSIEVYHNGSKVNTYNNLQDAVDSASSGDTIKITSDMDVVGGAYINKNLTIEGSGKTLNAATWANGVFVVEEGVTLNINNLTIDGGSSGFEVDYDRITFTNYTIPLVSGSDSNDVKQNVAAIISRGNLVVSNSRMSNNYNSISGGGAIRIVSGSLKVEESSFNHNRATDGGAISIGSNFEDGQMFYPVDSVEISSSDFNNNYSSNGGAIYAYNLEEISISKSNFISNTVTGGNGGAVMFNKQSTTAVSKGIDFIQATIDSCIFDGNWVGNDGFAIQNYDAELTTTNTLFNENVGVHPSSSVATYSMQVSRNEWAEENVFNCIFTNNSGAISGIGDHGGHVFLTIDGCKFSGNIGSSTIYVLTSVVTIRNCEFTNEDVNRGVVEVAAYADESEYEGLDYSNPTIIVEDTTFTDNDNIDILVYVRGYDVKSQAIIKGEVNGDIMVWNGTSAIISGVLNGNIATDRDTTEENVIINDDGQVNGIITYGENTYKAYIRFVNEDTKQITGYEQIVLLLEENKAYTDKELYMMHMVGEEDAKLVYYTDSSYTTLWNYTISANTTIYAKWEDHTHIYDSGYVLYKNAIYEQCECGYLGKKLYLEVPTSLTYTGSDIEIEVVNEISLSNYVVTYQYLNKDEEYVDMDGVPVKVGTYKAILTYNDMSISQEYIIEEKIENPNTGIMMPYIILGLIILLGVVGYKLIKNKKYL